MKVRAYNNNVSNNAYKHPRKTKMDVQIIQSKQTLCGHFGFNEYSEEQQATQAQFETELREYLQQFKKGLTTQVEFVFKVHELLGNNGLLFTSYSIGAKTTVFNAVWVVQAGLFKTEFPVEIEIDS